MERVRALRSIIIAGHRGTSHYTTAAQTGWGPTQSFTNDRADFLVNLSTTDTLVQWHP